MSTTDRTEQLPALTLQPVDRTNWRAVARLSVTPAQTDFVAAPSYYLALCAYDEIWRPLAITLGTEVIGFCMWGVDPADGSCWLGGILIDQQYQGQGYGKRSVQTALAMLATKHGHQHFALSYQPTNGVAKALYHSLGFQETGEWEDDEVIARLSYLQP